ncbi:DUF4238 domain-containing protein [uncultured Pseudacidovorax sp.]|uniref:DUF4238 domain-containing protein n=1 Tax=uncultured Pseudacidovorax sp. TaxID=679313 RepID=UPI0025FDAEFB|nr:DUF4238 domain-containing protein [uncultured Pseudacidovorax sp.]
MASNKNQHFVPRCYLRPFTTEQSDRALNLYNIDRQKVITGAPLKHQCSGDYFYGKDEHLEAGIQAMESGYAAAVKLILSPGYKLTDEHRSLLKVFWLMQHLRTEAASRRSVEISEAMGKVISAEGNPFRMEIKEAVQIAMRTFAESMDILEDLKVVLVRNRTGVPFLTSDDPAILTNRWHLHNSRRLGRTFGIQSAGNVMLLPISPSVLCLAYDGDVHSISHSGGWAHLKHDADADALNQHQYLNCRANVFFRDDAQGPLVHESFLRMQSLRPAQRHRLNYAIRDLTVGDHTRYVVVDPATAREHTEALIHTETVHAAPASWPRLLSRRAGAHVYTNGTGLGYVRKAFTNRPTREPFKRMQAFLG